MSERPPPPDAAGLRGALFPDPRTDILCALTHLQAARVRLGRHEADNVMRELAAELDTAQLRLADRLRAYPPRASL